jgi:predicted AAA+ superfamily ATPase
MKKVVLLQRISLSILYFELLRRGGEVYAGRTDAGEVDFVVMKHNGEREYY